MPNAQDPAKTGQQEEAVQALTEERVTEILNASVNAAVTNHLKRTLGKEVVAAVAAALEPIRAEFAKKPEPPTQEAEQSKSRPSPELVALQKQLADVQAALKLKDEEAATARRNSVEKDAFNALVSELAGKVRPGTEKMVATLLKAQGQLAIDDEGNATLKVRTSLARGQQEQDHEFPIAEGVGHYLKTKEADLFRPSPSGAGGDRRSAPGRTGGPQGARGAPVDAVQAFEAQHGSIDDHLL